MQLRNLASSAELEACVDMYIKYHATTKFPFERDTCIRMIKGHISRKNFMRVVEDENQIVGWLLGVRSSNAFLREQVLQQLFYVTNQTGFKSYRVCKLLHNDLLNYAEDNGIRYVIATSSHTDMEHIYVRLLAKMGWCVEGSMGFYDTTS